MFLTKQNTGVSIVEIMIAMVLAGVIVGSILTVFKTLSDSAHRVNTSAKAEIDLKRFFAQISNDIEQAGSDPTGIALQAYMTGPDCASILSFDYGINPVPSNAACDATIGEIGILSYLAYDQDDDGAIMPEEGLDLVSDPPTLRIDQNDYIVYDYYDTDSDGVDDTIRRINAGDPTDDSDDISADVLSDVASFELRYYGVRAGILGEYGEIEDISFYNDIREVEVSVNIVYGNVQGDYENPYLSVNSPWYNFRTVQKTYRISINVIKPESS